MNLSSLEQLALGIFRQALSKHRPAATNALFSGGHDSVTSTHLLASVCKEVGVPFQVVHLDTGTGIQATQDYVREVSAQFGWNLKIYRAKENVRANGSPDPMDYAEIVRRVGFPGPAGHTWMFTRLKERGIDRLMREQKQSRSDRVLLLSGVRKYESARRMQNVSASGYIDRRGSRVWTNLIADWRDQDCDTYMLRYDIPRNPIKDLLGYSGECNCGAMGTPQQWELLQNYFPDDPNVQTIARLHEEVAEIGFPWGWGEDAPDWWKESATRTELYARWQSTLNASSTSGGAALCTSCEVRYAKHLERPGDHSDCSTCDKKASCHLLFTGQELEPPIALELKPEAAIAPEIESNTVNISSPDMNMIPAAGILPGMEKFFAALSQSQGVTAVHATQGTQGGKPIYSATVPLGMVATLFDLDTKDVPEELRSQRPLNPKRGEAITSYILKNQPQNAPDHPSDRYRYVLGGLSAVVADADVEFTPVFDGASMGLLTLWTRKIALADGQHRRAGIASAIADLVRLGRESITVTFYLASSLEERQQIFSTLNRYAAKPSTGTAQFFDHDDPLAAIAREVRVRVPVFHALMEIHSTTIKKNSIKLFTFNSWYDSIGELLGGCSLPDSVQVGFAAAYWQAIAAQIPQWETVRGQQSNPAEIREIFMHHLGITLIALGRVGAQLIERDDWQDCISRLSEVDWARSNPLWDDLGVLVDGKVPKSKSAAIAALSDYLREVMGVEV